MNNLEWIEEEIKRYKSIIRIASGDKKSYYKEELKILQQIKIELEAWEAVKEILGLNVEIITSVFDESDIEGYILVYKTRGSCIKMYTTIEQQEAEIIKKALEIDND